MQMRNALRRFNSMLIAGVKSTTAWAAIGDRLVREADIATAEGMTGVAYTYQSRAAGAYQKAGYSETMARRIAGCS